MTTPRVTVPVDYETLSELHTLKGWLHGLANHMDLCDVVADGGVTAGMVYQQEATEFAGRLRRILDLPLSADPAPEGGAEWFGVTGAADETEALAVALFDARCPGIRMTEEDMHYYRAAAQRAMQAVEDELDTPSLATREDAQPVAWRYKAKFSNPAYSHWYYTDRDPSAAKTITNVQPLYTHPAPDAMRDSNLWWSAEDWELTFNSLEDAYDAATGGEMRGVAKLGRATEHDPVWALRIDFDTTGDGETDDYEIRLFRTVDDAYAYLAALQAEQKGGAA